MSRCCRLRSLQCSRNFRKMSDLARYFSLRSCFREGRTQHVLHAQVLYAEHSKHHAVGEPELRDEGLGSAGDESPQAAFFRRAVTGACVAVRHQDDGAGHVNAAAACAAGHLSEFPWG